tara:strand:+ start:629 stop:1801 length:1173 start_codon:yes stop_codon:yes gene_type:complete
MNLNELVPAPNAEKVNQLAKRVFGYALDLDNLSETKAKRLHKNLSSQMNIYESKLGSASQTRTKYYEMKIALEALTKHIQEKKGAKPDFLDLDKDGDTKEPMKKAAKDKEVKEGDGIYHDCAKKFEHKVYGECKVIPGEHTLLEDGTVTHYDATFVKEGETYIVRNVAVKDMYNVISEGHKHASKKKKTNERYGGMKSPNAGSMKADEGVAMVSTGGERDVTVMKTPDKSKRMTKRSMDKYAKPGAVKGESVVTEGAVEGSELIMAAKSMVDKYDAIIQDVGEMLNEELTPLVDKIRDEMGSDVAEAYLATMTQALNATMAGMKQDRMVADDASRLLTGEAPAAPMGEPMPAEGDIAPDEMAMEPIEDEFAAADAAQGGEEAPVGREKRA